MNGLSLLLGVGGWAFGLTVLYLCVRLAVYMHSEPVAVDAQCVAIDQEVDDTDAFYADLKRSVGI